MLTATEERDIRVRAGVYDIVMTRAASPAVEELSERLGFPPAEVRESLERLATAKALVLQRDSRDVLMANPFSSVPTPFAVHANGLLYYGNCIWDALGIPAMLHADARVESSCGCCGEAMDLRVASDTLEPLDGIVHFAIPAHQWWQDIVYN